MRITTKLVIAWDGTVLEHEYHEYDGPLDLACGGSTNAQNNLENEQAAFYQMQMGEYNTVFGEAQGILNSLDATLKPIVEAGPNQQGFSGAELNNLNSTAVTGSGQAYNAVKEAIGQQQAAQGGGNSFLPSGAKTQEQLALGTSAANNVSNQESQILQADYAQGFENFNNALRGEEVVAGQFNPIGMSEATTSSGNAAANTANQIAQENNSWEGLVGGALGAAGTALSSTNFRG